MGYQDVDVYKLKFEGRDGLEVTVEGLSTGELFTLIDLSDSMPASGAIQPGDPATRKALTTMMETLAASLVEWNVEDRTGQPVPLTLDGVKSLKIGLVLDIVMAWVTAQTQVDDGLGKDSSSGGTSAPAPSLPMAPRSPSPPS